jgi:hypothetical protein
MHITLLTAGLDDGAPQKCFPPEKENPRGDANPGALLSMPNRRKMRGRGAFPDRDSSDEESVRG